MRGRARRAYGRARLRVNAEEILRRFALNDEQTVRAAVGAGPLTVGDGQVLDAKTAALVRLAARQGWSEQDP